MHDANTNAANIIVVIRFIMLFEKMNKKTVTRFQCNGL